MVSKRWLSHRDIESQCLTLARKINLSGFKPDYVVGLTRGGLLPAVMLSHWFSVPMYTLKVTLRDGIEDDCDHNWWMAEHAFGHVSSDEPSVDDLMNARKNILIIDDINDSGATLDWIKQDWRNSCLPGDPAWDNEIWGHNVKFAVLVNNLSSTTSVDYAAMEINKAEQDEWIEFPWENWWSTATAE